VFVLGCPRSGTTLLYDMLLSAGGFAVYLAESNVFNVLALRFGDLSQAANRRQLLQAWLGSKLFRATGLDSQQIEKKIQEECRNPGDFLQIVMSEMCRAQGMQRWAENSPETILHLPLVKKLIPDALVIHIIRDGRDVAASLERVRYVRPFPWEDRQSLISAGVYWEWLVQQGRAQRGFLGPDYFEVHFEDLIATPQPTLDRIGQFIDHPLDYERIRRVAYGSVARPNTSFRADADAAAFNPVGRWKRSFSTPQLAQFERSVGKTLASVGYEPASAGALEEMPAGLAAARRLHRSYFETKLWFKQNPLIRTLRSSLTSADIDASVLAEDHPPEIRSYMAGLT
jgi:hypothetical protein